MKRDFDTPVRGAVVDTTDLIATRFSSRLINVAAPSRALARLAGQRKTRQRGRGLEFEEVRQYVPGDDVRAIDWRVTARSGEPHTKLFHEDHEQPIMVAVDLRDSMKFGSVNAFKSVLAAHTAALLLWSGLDRGERVGSMVLHEHGVDDFKAKRSRNTVLHALGAMARHGEPQRSGANKTSNLESLLIELQRVARPGGRIFLITDFSDSPSTDPSIGTTTAVLQGLRQLARRSQVVAIHICDPLERRLPRAGRYSASAGGDIATIDTADAKLRAAYSAEFDQSLSLLVKKLRECGVPLVQLNTDIPVLPALQRVFPAR